MSTRATKWKFDSGIQSLTSQGNSVLAERVNTDGDTQGWTLTRLIGRVGCFGYSGDTGVRSLRVLWGIHQSLPDRDPRAGNANDTPGEWLAWGVLVMPRVTQPGSNLAWALNHPGQMAEFDNRGQSIMGNTTTPNLTFRNADGTDAATWSQVSFWWYIRALYIEPA